MVDIESQLFAKLVREKELRNPTARNFDEAAWRAAWDQLTNRTDRDERLLIGALFFGRELALLRKTFEHQLFEGMGRRAAVALSVAMANYNFIILREKAGNQGRQRTRGQKAIHMGVEGRHPIEGGFAGNISSPDSATATIVDTLPHCIERATKRPDEDTGPTDFWKSGARLFAILSVEHSIRDFWQQVLWDGWALSHINDSFHLAPTDIDLATRWTAWIWRQESIFFQGAAMDHLNERVERRRGIYVAPFLATTVVGVGGKSKETRKFRFGTLAGHEHGQAWHTTENTILEESYLGPFIDAPLPLIKPHITCRQLQKIWCVLRDSTNVLASRCKEKRMDDIEAVERFALVVQRDELERAIIKCAELDADTVRAALNYFICNPVDAGAMFADAFWSAPILTLGNGEALTLVLASIASGSTIRRVESWLERGGLSDRLATARRGLRYEAWVREQAAKSVADNSFFSKNSCAVASISAKGGGEQIELLIRLRGLLIVAEVKCLLAPVEAMQHYNYLVRLEDAGVQAVRKAQWLESNPNEAAKALQISEEEAKSLRVVPIVVMNQGIGFGIIAGGARVVDFHFLNLFLADNSYIAGAAVRFADGRAEFQKEILYRTEEEAESKFETIMASPPPLKRYVDGAEWKDTKFPLSDGGILSVASCFVGDRMKEDAVALSAQFPDLKAAKFKRA